MNLIWQPGMSWYGTTKTERERGKGEGGGEEKKKKETDSVISRN